MKVVSRSVAKTDGDLPKAAWLWLPLFTLGLILAGRLAGTEFYDRWFYGELGIVELSTAVFSLSAAVLAILAWRQRRRLPGRILGPWLIIFALGAIYFAGEEMSWGQHILQWQTPASIQDVNDHGETNLHNITNWADEKPKKIVELATIIGGILIPIIMLLKGIRLSPARDWRYWFLPTYAVIVPSVIASILKSIERVQQNFDWYPGELLDMRMSEPQEMYFGLFFLLYAWSFLHRIKTQEPAAAG